MTGFACVLPFPTPDRGFVLGFEAGRVWEALRDDEGPHEATVHQDNAEVFLRMAESTGRHVRSDQLDENWMVVHFEAAP